MQPMAALNNDALYYGEHTQLSITPRIHYGVWVSPHLFTHCVIIYEH